MRQPCSYLLMEARSRRRGFASRITRRSGTALRRRGVRDSSNGIDAEPCRRAAASECLAMASRQNRAYGHRRWRRPTRRRPASSGMGGGLRPLLLLIPHLGGQHQKTPIALPNLPAPPMSAALQPSVRPDVDDVRRRVMLGPARLLASVAAPPMPVWTASNALILQAPEAGRGGKLPQLRDSRLDGGGAESLRGTVYISATSD